MTTRSDLARSLDAHLRRAALRVRARRLAVTLAAAGLAIAVVGAAAVSWEAARTLAGLEGDAAQVTAPLRPWLVGAVLLACAGAWSRGVSRAALAREVDRRLGLEDRTASALAVTGGAVKTPLGERLLRDATARLDAARPELDRAFPARPRGAWLRLLRAGSVLVAIWVAVVLAGYLLGSGGGGRSVAFLPGDAPVDGDAAQPPETTGAGATTSDEPPPDAAPEQPDPPPAASGEEAAPPEEPEAPVPETAPPAGPSATAELVLSAEVFSPGEDVLALAVARPGAGLAAPAGFVISIEVDGRVLGTGASTALDPGQARGTLTPVRIGRLAGAEEALRPGEHEAVLLLEPEGGGPAIRSDPRRFRIRGDEGGEGRDSPSPPPPEPEGSLPPPPPPPEEGEDETGGEPPPVEEGEPPPLPEQTERKVVVPLFADGEEIRKTGPRLVLVPGEGPDAPARSVPLEEALDLARRRSEDAVDRAGVRAEDRELVRRYFERLLRLAGSGR